MLFSTRVKLVLAEDHTIVIPGVEVTLYDRDERDQDDYLCTGVTNEFGEITFSFYSNQFADLEDQPSWRMVSLPDLYVVLYDAEGREVLTTRQAAQLDHLPLLITVPISRDLVDKHELLP